MDQYQQHAQYPPPGPWPPKLNEDGPEFDGEAGFPAFRFDADQGMLQAGSGVSGFNRQGIQMGQHQSSRTQVRVDQGYEPLTKSDLINKYGDGRGLLPGQGRVASVFEGTRPNPLQRSQTASAAMEGDSSHRAPLGPGQEHTSYDDSDNHPSARRNRARAQHVMRTEEFEQQGEEEGGLGTDNLSSSIAAYWHSESISAAYHGTGPPLLQRAHSAPGLLAHGQGGEQLRDQGMRGIMDLGFDDFMCNPIESHMGVARSEVRAPQT